jgi:hypothetical protein
MEQRTDRAYRLTWQTDYLESCDHEYELDIEEFPGSDWTERLMKISSYLLPEPVIFWGDPKFLEFLDYPTNDKDWPIMSRRMYYTLCTVGDFPHRAIPIAMMDGSKFTFEPERRFLSNGQPDPEITNTDALVAVQILEESNYFNFKLSEFEPDPDFPEWVHSVEKYVLNEPLEGFPPLFRLAAQATPLFISAKAREALKEAGIRGVAYYPLDNLQIEVDNPVLLPTYP